MIEVAVNSVLLKFHLEFCKYCKWKIKRRRIEVERHGIVEVAERAVAVRT